MHLAKPKRDKRAPHPLVGTSTYCYLDDDDEPTHCVITHVYGAAQPGYVDATAFPRGGNPRPVCFYLEEHEAPPIPGSN